MILDRKYYRKTNLFLRLWLKRQITNWSNERVFKVFKLFKTQLPGNIYFYSPRFKGVPTFIGTSEELAKWENSHSFEKICPTGALTISKDSIEINEFGCVGCGLCIEVAPQGLLERKHGLPWVYKN